MRRGRAAVAAAVWFALPAVAHAAGPLFHRTPSARPPRVSADTRAWTAGVLQALVLGARACLQARSPAELAATAPRFGARAAPVVPLASPGLTTPVWILGVRGEVLISATAAADGYRCTATAVSGDAAQLARDLPSAVRALGFETAAAFPPRWPGEASWRLRTGGVRLLTAAPFVHAAPYGATVVVARTRG